MRFIILASILLVLYCTEQKQTKQEQVEEMSLSAIEEKLDEAEEKFKEAEELANEIEIQLRIFAVNSYNRSNWRHWTDEDHNCMDTRQEVLQRDTIIAVSVNNCKINFGLWKCPYTGDLFTDPGDLDIDHVVPLKEAWLSGAHEWTKINKKLYANYLVNPNHLLAVYKGANRSKGYRDPCNWKPDDESFWCEYAMAWIEIKKEWSLEMDECEIEELNFMLEFCDQ